MTLPGPSSGNKKRNGYGAMSLLLAVPAILIAAPAIGFFGGQWLDRQFNTEPLLLIIGLVLGFAAAAREIYNLVKKSEQLEKEEDQE